MVFYFKNTKKDIIMTKKDEEGYINKTICRLCEKNNEYDKAKDHCHSTGKCRGPAHSKCNIDVTQKQSNFIPSLVQNLSSYDCHIIFKRMVDKKNDKVKFDIILKTNEEFIPVRYGCNKFIESYRLQSSSLDSLVKILVDNSHKTLKDLEEEIVGNDELLSIVNETELISEKHKTNKDLKKGYPDKIKELEEPLLNYMGGNELEFLKTEFPDKWRYLIKKIAYPYDFFNSIDDYQKPVNNLRKKHFFSKLKNDYLDDEDFQRTMDIIKDFNRRNGEALTQIVLKSDVLLLTCVFEKFIKVSIK